MRYKLLFATLFILLLSRTQPLVQDTNLYQEPYRPQFHYSPPCKWVNDPNGLVYYDGEYHLFFQYHPFGTTWGPMHWGHAVSTDLLHWQTLPVALYPDDIGTIFSGSIVIDRDNTAGFGENTMVAVYSYNTQSQGVAYSIDNGRTWTKYDGNPIIDALLPDFRDPKVFWHQDTRQWIMAISAGREIQFFNSPDLLNWEYMSSFHTPGTAGTWEVPDLFPMEIEGETKWVLIVSINGGTPAGGSATMYFIGDFDGESFVPDVPGEILWLDYGADNYAGTTFSNEPNGRHIHIGWMNNWAYAEHVPTSTWRGAMTIPRELSLVDTPDGLRLSQTPIPALSEVRESLGSWDELAVSGVVELENINGRELEIIAEFDPGSVMRSGISVHRNEVSQTQIIYSPLTSQVLISRSDRVDGELIRGFIPIFGAPVELVDGRLTLRILVDESSVEVFINDGTTALTALSFGDPSAGGVALFAEGGEATFIHMEVNALRSIWSDEAVVASQDVTFCD
ncbi:MAG: glycoside hydrolase family 32 protein [Aggregatilineales bacterium]